MSMAEQGLIAAALEADKAAEVFAKIRPEDFLERDASLMAHAIKDLLDNNRTIDLVTVAEQLEAMGYGDEAMSIVTAIYDLGHYFPSVIDTQLDEYIEIVQAHGLSKRLNLAVQQARTIIQQDQPGAALERVRSVFEDIEVASAVDQHLWTMNDATKAFIEEMQNRVDADGELMGLSTGFQALDGKINGMRGGDLVIIAGRPSMGKTTLLMNIGEYNAIQCNVSTLMFSLEMSAEQLTQKMFASQGTINMNSLQRGQLTEDEWSRFAAAGRLTKSAPIYVDDRPKATVAQIRARAYEILRQHNLGLILIDYLTLMEAAGDTRTQQVSEISRGLKQLSKELDIPVICLAQLNREVERRPNKRPVLSDLRESGAIEQDADVILFTYRDEYYNPDTSHPGIAEIITGKQRMGETGTVALQWQGQYSRFRDLDYTPDFDADEPEQEQPAPKFSGGMNV